MADENIVILEENDGEPKEEQTTEETQEESSDNLVSLETLHETPTEESEESKEEEPTAETQTPKNNKKLFIIVAVAGGTLLLLIIVLIVLLLTKSDTPKSIDAANLAKEIEQKFEPQKFGGSQIDDMIQKANLLYEKGNKFEALKIYENIALYNEGLSNYNLGVSQMKQQKYAEALESFKRAIANNENIAVSAINAAVRFSSLISN